MRRTVTLAYNATVTVIVNMEDESVEAILVNLSGMNLQQRHAGARRAQVAAQIVARSFVEGNDPEPVIA